MRRLVFLLLVCVVIAKRGKECCSGKPCGGHLHLDEQNVLASSGPCHVQMGQRMRMREGSEQGMVSLE